MDSIEIVNQELFDILLDSDPKDAEVIVNHLKRNHCLSSQLEILVKDRISKYFIPSFNKRWRTSCCNKNTFIQKNQAWLKATFSVSEGSTLSSQSRKVKNFEECSEKTKRRRVESLVKKVEMGNIDDALQNIETLNQKTISEIFDKGASSMLSANKSDIEDEKRGKSQHENSIPFTDDEALALFTDLNLTKHKYELLRKLLKKKNVDVLPSYKAITKAKQQCYPSNSAIELNEKGATVKLQELLDHTTERIFKIKDIVPPMDAKNLKMKVKYGCDGTSGINPYQHKSENSEIPKSSLFLMSMVPLQITTEDGSTIIWKNQRPSSPNSCLPILFHYEQETKEKISTEVGNIKKEIKRLKPGRICLNGITYSVNYELICSMIDGKVCQVLTATSSSSNCTVCGAKPSETNHLEVIWAKEENVDSFQYGLQTLHAWIRFMECILHIAYRLPFKQWACRSNEHKQILEERKKHIQKEIRKHLGLIVDMVKQGSGSTNDGNTARKFFDNYKKVSEITGVDEKLIENLYIILQLLSCGKPINTELFDNLASDTAKLYVKRYSWYYMPASMHKILIHGAKVINYFVVPIGQLSEEAQEARNKDFKRCRENNTRKSSPTTINEDILHFLLVSGDPFLGSLRTMFPKQERHLLPRAKEILLD